MKYLSLFSGIEAATVAWKPLGWTCVAVSEIEKFPCALLTHYYPNVPNLGDVTKITLEQIKALGQIDLVVFETAATLTRGFGDRGVDADQIANGNCAIQNKKVRRLTPLECERLQGFPDNYTNIPGATDTPRYSALGNSMAVPVMRWIGQRISKVMGVAA